MIHHRRFRRAGVILAAVSALLVGTASMASAGYQATCRSSSGAHTGVVKVHTGCNESPYCAVTYVEATHSAAGFSNFNVHYTDNAGVKHSFNRNTDKTYSYVTVTGHGTVFDSAVHWTVTWTGSDGYSCGK